MADMEDSLLAFDFKLRCLAYTFEEHQEDLKRLKN